MLERQRSWSVVQDWISCRVQASSHALFVALDWAATASSAKAVSTGCIRNAVGSSAWQRTVDPDYRCARELHATRWQTIEGSSSWVWQAGGGSFLLLPGRHALSSRWLWAFDYNTCENCLEEVQGADTSSLFQPPFFQDTWPCVQLLCAERNAPCQWNLAINRRLQRNDRAMIRQICNGKPQDTAHFRSTELLAWLGIEDLDLILKEKRRHWYEHMECSNSAVKTAFDIQIVGNHGPGRVTWKQLTERDCIEWKLSAIDPHDRDT